MRARILISVRSIAGRAPQKIGPSSPWVCSACQLQNVRYRQFATEVRSSPEKPYYITTPIFYVNAAPHVGHLYTMVLTDVLKRWQQLKGKQALLCTGTDEHGLKVQRAAAKAGINPKLFCNQGAEIFKELAAKAEIKYDHFARTTDREHRIAVEFAWFLLKEKGYIYTEQHEGWYSVTDEAFYTDSAVKPYLDPPTGKKMMVSTETGSEVEWSSEKNYHFRLSAFREPLLEFYKANPNWITPEHRMKEVVKAVETGLEDLSISRPTSRLTWGIRVPDDDTQTIYVWLDALMNYATKAGYPWTPGSESIGGWPADCHVIGKDIVRFHCIYWPAFLMALKLPQPGKILTHAHWTLGKSKMSKSTGKVVDPFHALDRFGSDVMRFYLTKDGGMRDDAAYDNVHIIKTYNTVLAGLIGNTLSRVTRGKKWSVKGAVERMGGLTEEAWQEGAGHRFRNNTLAIFPSKIAELLDAHEPRAALNEIINVVRGTNLFFHMSKPWSKVLDFDIREPGDEVDQIVYHTSEALRMIGILLQPFMPNKANTMLDQLGVDPSRRTFEYCKLDADLDYGTPIGELGSRFKGVLFPPLPSEE